MEKQPQGNLKEQIVNTVHELLVRNLQLAQGAKNAFETDDSDATEIVAALQLSEGISHTVRDILGSDNEHIIFSRDHNSIGSQEDMVASAGNVLPEDNKLEEERNEPKTFGELLTLKLDQALPDKEEFTRKELQGFTSGAYGSIKFFKSQENKTFSRNEAIAVLQKFLTLPDKRQEHAESFTKKMFRKPYMKIPAGTLDEWSAQIGRDWKETPQVNFQTRMEIIGLNRLKALNLPPKDKPLFQSLNPF